MLKGLAGRRVVKPQKDTDHWGYEGAGECHFPLPYTQPKFQKEPVSITELACTTQTPNAVLLWIHPSDRSASLPVPQGPSRSGPPKAKPAEPAPPAPVHLADPPWIIRQIPSKQHHKPGSVQVAQAEATPLHSESCPWESGR